MSIESNIKSIATSLERIAAALEATSGDSCCKTAAPAPSPAPVAAPAPAPAAPVAAPSPAPAPAARVADPATTAPGTSITPEELNAALVTEMTRIGRGRDPIDEVMKQQGITSVRGLTSDQATTLLNAVKAISA